MKKTIISLAIAAGMAASGAASAGVYGILHASIDSPDTGGAADTVTMESNTSAIGVKGSEDLGDGMKAFYKAEFQIDISERNNTITDRDQYIGLKGGMGTVKLGSSSNNYKQMGGKIDPMYRTALEGRSNNMQMQSRLHAGAGRLGGRMTDMVQYSSPKMGGMQLVVNTTFDGTQTGGVDNDETVGVGFRYAAKTFSVYVDMISQDRNGAGVNAESATKIGGTFKMDSLKLGAQMEQTEDLMGNDYLMLTANYSLDKNNSVFLSLGQMSESAVGNDGSDAMAVMYDHKMSKATDVYVGYGDRSDDAGGNGYSIVTAGMRVKF